jgi:hypothetical protein
MYPAIQVIPTSRSYLGATTPMAGINQLAPKIWFWPDGWDDLDK